MRSTPVLVLLSFLLAIPLGADTFLVTKLADTADGTCDGDCSLREALQAANAEGGLDTVTVPAGNFVINSELVISASAELVGAGASATVLDADGSDRVLRVAATGVVVRDLTVTGGHLQASCCGPAGQDGRHNAVRGSFNGRGAGILLEDGASATLQRVVVHGNTSLNFFGPALVAGGGLYVGTGAELDLIESTVTANQTQGQGVFTTSRGGGIAVGENASATLINSTLSHNTATSDFLEPEGQDLAVEATGSISLNHTSLVGGGTGGPSIYNQGTVTTANSILSGGCTGSVLSTLGGNLEAVGDTCGLTDASDQVAVPLAAVALGELIDNGGPTPTHAPSALSVAVEAALIGACAGTDQRGITRPVDADENAVADCDIGAVELVPGIFANGFESGDATGWSGVGKTAPGK